MERCPNCQACEAEPFPSPVFVPHNEYEYDPQCRCTMCGMVWTPAPDRSPLPPCPIHTTHEVGQTFISGKPICKHCGQFKEEWR